MTIVAVLHGARNVAQILKTELEASNGHWPSSALVASTRWTSCL
jgi:hypothetical protein